MGVLLELGRDIILDGALDGGLVLARADAAAVADAEDMGVHRLRGRRNHMFRTTLAVLRPTPGRVISAARLEETSPP